MSPLRLVVAALVVGSALSCTPAAHAGLPEGLAALRKGDFAAAARELQPLAERGDAEAQYRLGLMYEFGRGFPVDKAKAMTWLRKSANQGNTSAQQELGVIYATGDGVPKDDAQAVAWFRRAADLGNATAQFNLGLMIAKGTGAPRDDALAVSWFRKAAEQGFAGAQSRLGIAYEFGEGVARNPAIAYANYAIAARSGNADYAAQRDKLAGQLTPSQLDQGRALAAAWEVGRPLPAPAMVRAPVKDRCSATGQMEGEKFTATNCTISLYGDQHSVAIWFNTDAITPQEVEQFHLSSYASSDKGGKPRTMLVAMFCPGGGDAQAAPAKVKSMDLNTTHARSPIAGLQTVLEAPGELKVEKLSGDVVPGGTLTGRITGGRGRTSLVLEFELNLPSKDAAAGFSCGK